MGCELADEIEEKAFHESKKRGHAHDAPNFESQRSHIAVKESVGDA
jgi:hypothetical protein